MSHRNNISYKLPLFDILLETLSLLQNRILTIIKLSLPFLGMLIIYWIWTYHFKSMEQNYYPFVDIGILVLLVSFLFATFIMGLVGCHKAFLLGDVELAQVNVVRWGKEEDKYVGWIVSIFVLSVGLFLLFVIFAFMLLLKVHSGENNVELVISSPFIIVPVCYFVSRWLLTLPAAVIKSDKITLKQIRNLTNGNNIRLFILVSFIPILLVFFRLLLPDFDSVFFLLLRDVFIVILVVIEIGVISVSYSFLIEKKNVSE